MKADVSMFGIYVYAVNNTENISQLTVIVCMGFLNFLLCFMTIITLLLT